MGTLNHDGVLWTTDPEWMFQWPEYVAGWESGNLGPRQTYSSIREVRPVSPGLPSFEPVSRWGSNPQNGLRNGILKNLPDQTSNAPLLANKSVIPLMTPFEIMMRVTIGSSADESCFLDNGSFRLSWTPTPGDTLGGPSFGTYTAVLTHQDGTISTAQCVDPAAADQSLLGGTSGRHRVIRAGDSYLLMAKYDGSVLSVDFGKAVGGGPIKHATGGKIEYATDRPEVVIDAAVNYSPPAAGSHSLTIGDSSLVPGTAWKGLFNTLFIFDPLDPDKRDSAADQIEAWAGS